MWPFSCYTPLSPSPGVNLNINGISCERDFIGSFGNERCHNINTEDSTT